MHVRVRLVGTSDAIVVVESKLTKIDQFRKIIKEKFDVEPKLQRLFYGGKLLENGYTFHDYNIKLNDVIQLMAKVQPDDCETEETPENSGKEKVQEAREKTVQYRDAESTLYTVGDLVDTREKETGAWLEGKIARIVLDPDVPYENDTSPNTSLRSSSSKDNYDKQSNLENNPPEESDSEIPLKTRKVGIAKYFSKSPKGKKQAAKEISKKALVKITDENLLYKVQLEADDEDSNLYCRLNDIRPRARTEIEMKDLKPGQTVMINHNTDNPTEKGYWYDFKVDEVKKLRTSYELVGTLYLGQEPLPQNDTVARVHDKIYAIEEAVPLKRRTDEYKELISTVPEKRSQPLNCMTCRDDEKMPCKECGCYLCSGKENPEKIVLCDECNNGFHMVCLTPPLTELPDEDWYCPSCKRDPTDVVAPGAAKQTKKSSASKSNRDWGRGMACVGKTKTCAMPPNHFGPIPGIEVGMCWRFRIQLSESGVHRPPVSGIHGRDVEGAYSIVLSGGYEDDVDHGIEFTYTGSGGRDLSGNKRTAEQSCDQTLTRENKALARNCAVKLDEAGADAGGEWRGGRPVRVVRSYKMLKHFPKYAPKEGIRYDGIYKVVKYYPEQGLSGYRVWKYLLRRDDPCPAPWEPGAKRYPIVYPDGYLEAEAEKRALKEKKAGKTGKPGKPSKPGKKRALRESNQSTESEAENSPPVKKRKTSAEEKQKRGRPSKKNTDSPKAKADKMFRPHKGKSPNKSPNKSPGKSSGKRDHETMSAGLSAEEMHVIRADNINSKLWQDCLDVSMKKSRQEFLEYVAQVFLCIICQDVAVNPVTTPCLHNFCMACIKLAYKSTDSQTCPYCRHNLSKVDLQPNDQLRTALRSLLSGYDAGKK